MNYKHLTTDERYHIDELLREGHSQTTIAKRLGRFLAQRYRESSDAIKGSVAGVLGNLLKSREKGSLSVADRMSGGSAMRPGMMRENT